MDAWESIYPLQKWCRLFALWNFERDYTGLYKRRFKHKADTVLFSILFALLVFIWLPNKSITWGIVEDSMLISYLMNLYVTLLPTIGLYSFVIVQIISQTKINILTAIDEVDGCLKAMNCQRQLANVNLHIWKFCIIAVACGTSSVLLGVLFNVFMLRNLTDTKLWLQTLAGFLHILCAPRVSHYPIHCLVCCFAETLRTAEEYLDEHVNGINFPNQISRERNSFSMAVRDIAYVHYKLIQISRKVVTGYSFSLLVQIVSYFIIILCEGYILVYVLILTDQQDPETLMATIHYVCSPALELFAIVYITEKLCFKVKQLLVII